MTQAIVQYRIANTPHSFDEVVAIAEKLAASSLLPVAFKGKAIDLVFAILTGQELGLTPMAAIRGIHVIQGRPTLAADTLVAIVLRSGLCDYFSCVESTHERATFETKRKGAPEPQRVTWTLEDAKRAALTNKDNWRLFTRQMLAARARSELARMVYPDVIAGFYDPDEIEARDEHGNAVEKTSGGTPAPTWDPIGGRPYAPTYATTFTEWRMAAPNPSECIEGVEVPHAATAADAEYERASDELRANLDHVLQTLLEQMDACTSQVDLDRLVGGSPAIPPKGTKEHEIVTAKYKAMRAKIKASK